MDLKKEKKKKKKKEKKKTGSLLSFGDQEEGEEVFEIKKKKKKKKEKSAFQGDAKERKAKRRASKLAKVQPYDAAMKMSAGSYGYLGSSGTGSYTPEEMAKLKNNAIHVTTKRKHFPPPKTRKSKSKSKLKKPESSDSDSEGASAGTYNSTAVTATSTTMSNPTRSVTQMALNDPTKIRLAKEKRERLRTIGVDFIPLKQKESGNSLEKSYGNLHSEEHGTLLGEHGDDDDHDTYNDERGNRIPMGDPRALGKSRKHKRRQIGALFNKTDRPREIVDDQEDEEFRRWEEEQIKKGGGTTAAGQAQAAHKLAGKQQAMATARKEEKLDPEATVASITKMLQKKMKSMKKRRKKCMSEMQRVEMEIEETSNELDKLDDHMESSKPKFYFYQTLRDAVTDCLACLNAKAPIIEEAADEMESIQQRMLKSVMEKEEQNLLDIKELAFGSEDTEMVGEPKLDEFGRDINYIAQQGKEARKTAREKVRQARKAAMKAKGEDCPDGWETDNEGASEEFRKQKISLLKDADDIFLDAKQEYRSFDNIQAKLFEWKTKYHESYKDAYMPLSVPTIFAPYVRLELLHWHPLEGDDFKEMNWYVKLMEYGTPQAEQDTESVDGSTSMAAEEEDDDLNLIPKLIEKILIPYLVRFIEYEWDPLSSRQHKPMCSLVHDVMNHLDEASKGVHDLAEAVMTKLRSKVDGHSKTPSVPNQHNITRAWTFCSRRWWRAVKLFTHICQWRKVLKDSGTQELASSFMVESVMPFFALALQPAVQRAKLIDTSGILEMCKRLVSAIPRKWVSKEEDSAISKLYKLMDKFSRTNDSNLSAKQLQALSKMQNLIQR